MFDLLGEVLSLRGKQPEEIKLQGKAVEFAFLLSCAVVAVPSRPDRKELLDTINRKLLVEINGDEVPGIEDFVSKFDSTVNLNELNSEGRANFFNDVWLRFRDWADDDKSVSPQLNDLNETDRISLLQTYSRITINRYRELVSELVTHDPEGVIPQIESQNSGNKGKEN